MRSVRRIGIPVGDDPDAGVMLLERAAVFGAGPLVATEQQIQVPSGTGKDADSAEWVLSGTLNIRTEDGAKSPK